MIQKTLFDELDEVSKKPFQVAKPLHNPVILHSDDNNVGETFEELEKRVASKYGRRHIGYPCDIAQDMPIDDRHEHIKNCDECKRLEKELNETVGYNSKGV